MAAPNLMTTRRFSPPSRLRLQVVFAKAWEELVETYRIQAAEFVRRMTPRLPVEEALDRYFREVGVPAGMAEAVRARALLTLAPVIEEAAGDAEPASEPASRAGLRLDTLFGALRRRVQYIEDINLHSRLAACLADEAIAATHVRMAIETAEVLVGELPPDEAIMHYVRSFDLPSLEAQIIYQRAMAQWAERHPAPAAPALVEPALAPRPASPPVLALPTSPSFGLRVIM